MSTVKPQRDPEADPRVRAVFDEIRALRGTDYVNNVWRYLAFDPSLLEQTWAEVRDLMAKPTKLDPKVKEMIYIAVSIANACDYCVHSHTASAKAKGMSDEEHGELLRLVATASKTNALLNGIRPPIDDVFDAERD